MPVSSSVDDFALASKRDALQAVLADVRQELAQIQNTKIPELFQTSAPRSWHVDGAPRVCF